MNAENYCTYSISKNNSAILWKAGKLQCWKFMCKREKEDTSNSIK